MYYSIPIVPNRECKGNEGSYHLLSTTVLHTIWWDFGIGREAVKFQLALTKHERERVSLSVNCLLQGSALPPSLQ